MKHRVEIGIGMMLLTLTTQTSAFAATASYSERTTHSAHSSSPRATQPHVPGYLGIVFHDTDGHGVEIEMVDHDGPAGKSGLRPHDLILSLNGQSINSSEGLTRMIREVGPGTVVLLSVQRDGKTTGIKVQLAKREDIERSVRIRVTTVETGDDPPVSDFTNSKTAESTAPATTPQGRSFLSSVLHTAPFTGLGLQVMAPQLAEYFGDTQGIGLLVQMIVPNSPASFSGLRAGDIVLRADTVAIKTPSDWSKRLRANLGQSMQLTVLRDKHEINVTLTPEAKHHSMLEWPKLFN